MSLGPEREDDSQREQQTHGQAKGDRLARAGSMSSTGVEQPKRDIYARPASRLDRTAYFLDRILAKRSGFFLLLAIWGLLQVTLWGSIYQFFWTFEGPDSEGGTCGDPRQESKVYPFIEGIWEAWTFMADPGTHAKAFLTGQRTIGSLIAISGILFWSTVMALTVDVIREKMDTLRQGRSKIVESGHTLILGWTEKTMHIIEELCNANESEGGGVIAVLAPERKDQMESELSLSLPLKQRRGTRVIFRSGSPLVLGDLVKVSVNKARSIIILSTASDADRADADTLRTLLSVKSLHPDSLDGHIVAEVRDIDNEPLVKLVGGSSVETLVSHDVIGRFMLMSVRQPGLAKVYESLLGFDGDEFYMAEWSMLVGVEFRQLFAYFPSAIPIGVFTEDRTILLGPPGETVIMSGDKIIVIAQDNDSYFPEEPQDLDAGSPPEPATQPPTTEKILFCGWRRDIRDVLQQLDKLVQPGTEVHMMTHSVTLDKRDDRLLEDGLDVRKDLRNLTLQHFFGNTSVRRKLELLPIQDYTSCLIFADQDFELDTMHSDSHSLATLLLIRDIQVSRRENQNQNTTTGSDSQGKKNATSSAMTSSQGSDSQGKKNAMEARALSRSLEDFAVDECPIICEVLDPHTQKTISRSKQLSLASDFCQTNKLVAQVLSMVSEERFVKLLLDELLGSTGCNIAVVPSAKYASEGEVLSFMQVAKRASMHGEVLIGYQLCNTIERTALNPPDKEKPFVWDNCDFAIIQGEECLELASREQSASVNRLEQREERRELSEAVERCVQLLAKADQDGLKTVCARLASSELGQFSEALNTIRSTIQVREAS